MQLDLVTLLQRQTVGPELLLRFLLAFARFEFSLKAAGYLKRHDGKAEPNWVEFARDPALESPSYPASVAYLRTSPPARQVAQNGILTWAGFKPIEDADPSTVLWYTTAICGVRNNLFHGGKFPFAAIAEPARDRNLLEACLGVLEALLLAAAKSSDKPRALADAFNRPYDGE